MAVAEWTPSCAFSVTVAVEPPGRVVHFVVDHFEQMQPGMQRLAHQQFEGAFGGFELIALKFHLLDAVEQLAARRIVQALVQAVLLQLIKDACRAPKDRSAARAAGCRRFSGLTCS